MPLDHAILAVLTRGPLHGHALGKELDRLLHGLWAVNPGQVYATLGRLTRAGAVAPVEADGAGRARAYALSAAGWTALRRWLDRPRAQDAHADPFLQQLAVLLANGDRERTARALAGQRRRCTALRTLLERRSHARRHVDDLVAEAARRHIEVELEWLAGVERAFLALDPPREAAVDAMPDGDPAGGD